MDTLAFLKTVITTPTGYFNLAIRHPQNGEWEQLWYNWPDDIEKIVDVAQKSSLENNVYFTAHLFNDKKAIKANVLPSRTIQADLDDAVIPVVNVPNIIVETSPNRHQGFWILESPITNGELESLSKQVTYSILDADRSGWSLGHKMRIPGTLNHKYNTGPKQVHVISANIRPYATLKPVVISQLDEIPSTDDWVPSPLKDKGPRELWAEIRQSLPRRVQGQYDIRQQDRSTALWGLMTSLFRLSLDREAVFWIARESANNKFKDNRYHGDLDLQKDVLRAERAIKSGQDDVSNIKTRINDIRRLPGMASEKRAYIAAVVQDAMSQQGNFVATNDGQEWFIREDTGRPIILTIGSEYMNSFIEMRYGLNPVEPEQKYLLYSLMGYTKENGIKGSTASMSHYIASQNLMLLHTGRRDVLHIDSNNVSSIANGNLNIVFPWREDEEPFIADVDNAISIDSLFDGCFVNLNEMMPEEEALAILKAWLYFIFFRDDAMGRPILALFGQPGSGKSTLMRRIYTLLYGPQKAVASITSQDDFDHIVSQDPLVVFDNVDTWVSWLPDKLAIMAAPSDLKKRKLYTNTDTITLRRQAIIAITAHNPKFRREDIVDRLLIINLHRLKEFKPEADLLKKIYRNRDKYWGGIVNDIQRILQTPPPKEDEIPKFRVSDFARIGLWISRALGFEKDFVNAISRNLTEQVNYNLEEEDILVEVITDWIKRANHEDRLYTIGELWTHWSTITRDPLNFARMYKNSIVLGKKLWSLQDSLSSIFNIEFEFDARNARRWKISSK